MTTGQKAIGMPTLSGVKAGEKFLKGVRKHKF
jgi:hypothetical protein